MSSMSSMGGGNTKPPPRQISPAKKWCFTWNNWDSSIVPEFQDLLAFNGKYGFGEEKGNGTPHLQGWVAFNEKKRPMSVFKDEKYKAIHWEKMKGTIAQSIDYCTKEKGPYNTNEEGPEKLEDIVEEKGPLPWQKDVIDMVQGKPHPRHIWWYWNNYASATGKSDLCRHLVIKYGAIFVNGDAKDVKCGVALWRKAHKNKMPKIIIFGYPRSMEGHVSFDAIESVKDALFFSTKYESAQEIYNKPWVLCFANFPPIMDALTADRWKVVCVPDQVGVGASANENLEEVNSRTSSSNQTLRAAGFTL